MYVQLYVDCITNQVQNQSYLQLRHHCLELQATRIKRSQFSDTKAYTLKSPCDTHIKSFLGTDQRTDKLNPKPYLESPLLFLVLVNQFYG